MIGYGRQQIDEADLMAVREVLLGDWLTCGPAIEGFEREIQAISGAQHAIAVANGTAALRVMYQAVGIGPGVRVGVPDITFMATAMQVQMLGGEVVLLDVDPQTLLLTPEILEQYHGDLDVVIPVHMAGRLCDMQGIAAWAKRRNVRVLEDAAHAFGSSWTDSQSENRKCGDCSHSEAAIFSFHPVKNITCGEGGAIVTNDDVLADRCRSLRHHGLERHNKQGPLAAEDGNGSWYHEFHEVGGNERLSDIHAALGRSQCAKLDIFKQRRAEIIERYRAILDTQKVCTLAEAPANQQPFWHLCQIHVDWEQLGISRQDLFQQAREAGYGFQVHYIPLHTQPVLAECEQASDLSGAMAGYKTAVSVPCYPGLTDSDVEAVCRWLMSFVA